MSAISAAIEPRSPSVQATTAFDPQFASGMDQPDRDLAAVRDQESTDHDGLRRSRKAVTPSRPSAPVRASAIRSGRSSSVHAAASRTNRLQAAIASGPDASSERTTSASASSSPFSDDHLVHESQPKRLVGVEPSSGGEQGAGRTRTDRPQHVGRDRRRDQAEPHLGERERRALGGDRDVGARDETGTPAERRAVDPRHDGLRACVDGLEGGRHPFRVRDVLLSGELATRRHPVEIGTGAERGARPTQDHDPDHRVGCQFAEGIGERLEERRIQRVPAIGTVQGHGRDRALSDDLERAHIRKTPNRVGSIGVRDAASRPSASTFRVSAGSITPSSHSRAVEWYGFPSSS